MEAGGSQKDLYPETGDGRRCIMGIYLLHSAFCRLETSGSAKCCRRRERRIYSIADFDIFDWKRQNLRKQAKAMMIKIMERTAFI